MSIFSGSSAAAFLVASLILAVTPGPGVFYIVTRSISHGRRAGLASVAGVALGNLGSAVGASVGLATLFALSSLAFQTVRYAGAAYLVWLGIRALRAPPVRHGKLDGSRPGRIFRDGLVVALLNPKTALFFSAFLPQFMDPRASTVLQGVLLGAIFVLIASCTDTVYALAASGIAPRLSGTPAGGLRASRYFTAGALIGLGVYSATSTGSSKPG